MDKAITKNKTAILRGVGGYYGHVVKAEIIGFDEKEQIVRVKLKNNKHMDFSIINGWEHLEQKLYSTYQLDINHLKAYENESWMYGTLDNIG
ncbi:hypothetical protein [Confluentibacter lentus]|uniref:hypothetical protein n=1 Tax=Confluentibacter lentus TaxID=1699412 RepID=UPI000C282956|nr:hypothetical protein [Confluentibacter lentus]